MDITKEVLKARQASEFATERLNCILGYLQGETDLKQLKAIQELLSPNFRHPELDYEKKSLPMSRQA